MKIIKALQRDVNNLYFVTQSQIQAQLQRSNLAVLDIRFVERRVSDDTCR